MLCTKCNQPTGADWKTLCRNCWKSQTPDQIRAYRQQKLDRKITRMKTKAERLDQLGESKQAEFKSYHGDISFFTQPNINSSKGRAFTRYREKLYNRYDAGVKLQIEADELREKAGWMEREGAVVKGDAERKRQAKREALDKVITVGSKVAHFLYGEGHVLKVNKKTYTTRFAKGSTYAVEKTHVEPIKV